MNIANIFLLEREKEAEASFSGIKGIEKITPHHLLLRQRKRSNDRSQHRCSQQLR